MIPSNMVSSNGIGVVSDDNLNTYVQTDQTAAQLRGFVGLSGMCVALQGITAPGDGEAGLFYWSSGSYTDDNENIIVPPGAAGQGAWLRSSIANTISGNLTVKGSIAVTNGGSIGGNLTVGTIAAGIWDGTIPLPSTEILVGNSLSVAAAVSMSGDATISNTGAVTVSSIGGEAVTLGGPLVVSGAYPLTVTLSGTTSVVMPNTGTLANLSGTQTFSGPTTFSNKTSLTAAGTALSVTNSVSIGVNLNVGGVLTLGAAPNFASATTGAATQTFTNSPATGSTVAEWIPVTITGQSGTYYVPAVK